MRPSLTFRSTARWPFWLLVMAWFCANSPQSAVYAVLKWTDGARHFTHQQRLAADVATLLGSSPGAVTEALPDTPASPQPLPPVPEAAVLKKVLLSMDEVADLLPHALRAGHPIADETVCPEPRRSAPPHEPPRRA